MRVKHTLDPLDDRNLEPARARTGRRDPQHKADVRRFNQERANVVRERLKVSEVVGTSVTLKRVNGTEFLGLCPFHGEKTPSFTVNDKKGFYHCFGCGAHGNAISFVMEYQGLGYVEAVRDLAEKSGVSPGIIRRIEDHDGPLEAAEDVVTSIRAAFIEAGVEFLFPPDGKPAVRLS